MGLFDDVDDFDSQAKISPRVVRRKEKYKYNLLQRMEEIKKVIPEIQKGITYHLISSDNFGSIELLNHLLQLDEPKELTITTWSYNQNFVDLIKDICEKVDIKIIVDKSMGKRKHSLFNQLKELAADGKLKFKQHYMIHSKVTLLKTENLNISIESSANYSNNQRVENFNICESSEVYLFHKNWINKIVK